MKLKMTRCLRYLNSSVDIQVWFDKTIDIDFLPPVWFSIDSYIIKDMAYHSAKRELVSTVQCKYYWSSWVVQDLRCFKHHMESSVKNWWGIHYICDIHKTKKSKEVIKNVKKALWI